MSDLTPDRLARLRALATEATPGPWFFDGYSRVVSKAKAARYDDIEFPECEVPAWKSSCGDGPRTCHGCPFFEQDYRDSPIVAKVQAHHGDTAIGQRASDAEYVAAVSPDVMLGLLYEIERLRADQRTGAERVEIAREFMDPAPGDVPIPWNAEFHGEPDLTHPPPSASRGLPMRWVTRTVVYGPWRPVVDEAAAT